MIRVDGREYHTLNDELFANGVKVVEAYANGAKVYPDRVMLQSSVVIPTTHDEYELSSYMQLRLGERDGADYNKYWVSARRYMDELRMYGYKIDRVLAKYGDPYMTFAFSRAYKRMYSGEIDLTIDCDDIFYYKGESSDRGRTIRTYLERGMFDCSGKIDRPDPFSVYPRDEYYKQPFMSSSINQATSYDTYNYVKTFPCIDIDKPIHLVISGNASCNADFHGVDDMYVDGTETLVWKSSYISNNPRSVGVDMVCTLRDLEFKNVRSSDKWFGYASGGHGWLYVNDNLLIGKGSTSIVRDGITYWSIERIAILSDPPGRYDGGLYPEWPGSIICIFTIDGYEVKYYI